MSDEAPTQRFRVSTAPPQGGFAPGQTVFGRYLLEVQVGRGGMGVVWRARDEKLERAVALKFLPPEVAADAEAVRDLKSETRRCLDLTHVNIVRVYDFVEEGPNAAIAMEYVEGESLAKIKAAAPGGCLSATDLAPFVAQLCAALRYAHHAAKIAHHDLKPANVLVTRDGVLKVTDFGIARSLSETQRGLTGKVGNTSGTLLYMSPQQLAGEKPTAADDLYALGATLYELLTGKPPFFRGDTFSLRQQVIERRPAPLAVHREDVGCTGPEIPARWAETVLACLEKKPEDRPASAGEVAVRLGLAPDTGGTTPPLAMTMTAPAAVASMASPPAPRRSYAPWLISVGLALLLLTAGGISFYFQIYAPEQERLAAEQDRAHRAEVALHAEQFRQAEEKRRAAEQQAAAERAREEETRVQAAKDQQAYSAVMARIAALMDNSPVAQVNEIQQVVRNYLRTAPGLYRDAVEKAWADRQAAWRAVLAASRPGSLVVETEPPGATVVLYPRNQRKTSPAFFDDVKPGDVSLRIEKDGFESRDVPFLVKPGITHKLDLVRLVPTFGTLVITSDPPDIYVLVEGNERRLEGHTPFTPPLLPPGDYRVTYQRGNRWRPVVKTVTVERGKPSKLAADLRGFDVDLRSVPAGAQIAVDRQLIGAAPVKILGVEPREYVVTATLDGYENFTKTITVTRNDTITLALTEKPLPHALRRLTGSRWVYDSMTTTVELTFNLQGRITGTHRVGLGGRVQDLGSAESYNVGNGTFVAHFAANAAKPFYAGEVRIKIMDDSHLAVTWTIDGSAERLVLQRTDPAQK